MRFEIQQSNLGESLLNEFEKNRFLAFRELDGKIETTVDVQCSFFRDVPSGTIQMRGSMQFLEFSDRVFFTPIINIDIDFANRPPCVSTLGSDLESTMTPEDRSSLKRDLTLCSIANDMDSIGSSEGSDLPDYGRLQMGGAVLSSEKLLARLLNKPIEIDPRKAPACFFGALAQTAQGQYDVETVKRVLGKFYSLYEHEGWRFKNYTQIRDAYFVRYLRSVRTFIDSQPSNSKGKEKLDFQIFSSIAKALAKNVHSENARPMAVVLEAMGKGAQDAIPELLPQDGVFYEKSKLKILLTIAPPDSRVIKALMSFNKGQSHSLLSSLVPYVKDVTDIELLKYVIENSSYLDLTLKAFETIFSIDKDKRVHQDKLIDFAKKILWEPGIQELSDQQKEKIYELLLSLNNRDQDLMNLFLSIEVGTRGLEALSKMGARARIAAPRLLKEFASVSSLYYFQQLDDTMKKIHASKSDLRRAYQLAKQSLNSDVRAAATKAQLHLNSKAVRVVQ